MRSAALAEAIAIVWAPTAASTVGYFSLTAAGLHEIGSCELRGFHPHSAGLYAAAEHVVISNRLQTHVIDLREPGGAGSENSKRRPAAREPLLPKRRKLSQDDGPARPAVASNSQLGQALNAALQELDHELAPEDLQDLVDLGSCPHQCVSAARALRHAHASADHTARQNAALFDQCIAAAVAEQKAVRYKMHPLLMAARKQINQFRFARGHKAYDACTVRDIAARLQAHPEALRCIQELELMSASPDAGQHRAIDDLGEQQMQVSKHEPRRSDKPEHWNASTRTLAKQINTSSGSQREAIDAFFGMTTRARRTRTEEPVEESLQSMESALRHGLAFADRGRQKWYDLDGQQLAAEADTLFHVGRDRTVAFVTERYVARTVPVHAPRSAADTAPVQMAAPQSTVAAPKDQQPHAVDGKAPKEQPERKRPKRKARAKAAEQSGSEADEEEDELYDPSDSDSAGPRAMSTVPDADSIARNRPPRNAANKAIDGIAAVSATESSDPESEFSGDN